MLEVSNVSFWYNEFEPPIVYKCSFCLPKGNIIAIVGESGGGKTTLLRLSSGLLQVQYENYPEYGYRIEGKVCFNKKEIDKPHHKFGYVPQNFHLGLIPALNARKNILLSATSYNTLDQNIKRMEQLLRYFGISDVSHLKIKQLSGGQQQRVTICRTLLTEPEVLFMDEPFANLDLSLKHGISNLLLKFRDQNNLSLLLVTHDIEAALFLADKVLGMKRGYGLPQYQWWDNNGKNKIQLKKEIEDWIGN